MKGHQSYVVQCRSAGCRERYELLTARALTAQDHATIKRVRCTRCYGAVNVIELGETGSWKAQRAARAAA